VLECWKSEIPVGRGNYSNGPLSFLEGSSADMLRERYTGGEGKHYSSGPLSFFTFFLNRRSDTEIEGSSAGMLEERDNEGEGKL